MLFVDDLHPLFFFEKNFPVILPEDKFGFVFANGDLNGVVVLLFDERLLDFLVSLVELGHYLVFDIDTVLDLFQDLDLSLELFADPELHLKFFF